MTTESRVLVLRATDHLAARLDGIIEEVLSAHLGGLEWTTVLTEIDRLKGKRPMMIARNDLQSQLRILTERLGALGYPFDDEYRTVSTVAGDLRTVRRKLAHTSSFTELEAWRAADHCVRLLEALEDREGLVRATENRHEAFLAYAEQSGLGPAPAHSEDASERTVGSSHTAVDGPTSGLPSEVPDTPPSVAQIVRGDRGDVYYEPWPGRLAGGVDVLDSIARNESKAQVRALAEEIVDFEWPITLERLAREVGRGFGLKRVTRDRVKKIVRQIRNTELYVDKQEFVWPTEADRAAWSGFRTADDPGGRPFEEISPLEIANALKAARRDEPGLSDQNLELLVMEKFGRSKKTKGVLRQLDLAWELL